MADASARARARPRTSADGEAGHLLRLAARLREARAQRGMTRKDLARDSGVSLRFLAQLESGRGNPSLIVLRRIATALDLPLESLVSDSPQPVNQSLVLRLLGRLTPEQLVSARRLLTERFADTNGRREARIALIGLRGAGKSTLGRRLAKHLGMPFVELDREVEREYGATIGEILALHGQMGFRRYERQCLLQVLERHPRCVIETGGGLATDPETFEILLARSRVVWIRTSPEEHMRRVIAQGDLRPMAKSKEAMSDLRAILKAREPYYGQAHLQLMTSRRTVPQSFKDLLALLGSA